MSGDGAPRPLGRRLLVGALRVILLLLVAVPLVIAGFLYKVQGRMIYFPRAYEVPAESLLRESGGTVLKLTTMDAAQHAYWIPGKSAAADSPIYFAFNGNAGRALDWLDEVWLMQKSHPDWSFCLVDYPGYGDSKGTPTRDSIMTAAEGARAALLAKLGISDEEMRSRTRTLGLSMGCAVALEFATRNGSTEIVLISPFTTLLEMAGRSVGPVFSHVLRDRWDNLARMEELAAGMDRPKIYVYHGAKDDLVPVEMSRRLASAHPEIASYTEMPGLDHNNQVTKAIELYLGAVGERDAAAGVRAF